MVDFKAPSFMGGALNTAQRGRQSGKGGGPNTDLSKGFGATFNSKNWGTWDRNASSQLAEMAQLYNQITSAGGQITPQQAEMYRTMVLDNESYRIGSGNKYADRAYAARIGLYDSLKQSALQLKKDAGTDRLEGFDPNSGWQAPTADGGMGDWQGVGASGTIDDWATKFGWDQKAPANTNQPVPGDPNYTFDPSMLAGTTGTNTNYTVPVGGLTTGQGTVQNQGGVNYQIPTSNAPAAQGPTAGTVDTTFRTPDSGFFTGDKAIDAELMKTLRKEGTTSNIEGMLEKYYGGQLARSGEMTPDEQLELDKMKADAQRVGGQLAEGAKADTAMSGLRGGGKQLNTAIGSIAARVSDSLFRTELEYKNVKSKEKRDEIARSAEQANSFLNAIRANDTALTKTILDTRAEDLNRELSSDEMTVKYGIMGENLQLLRDTFTEDQRQSLKKEGFTDREITAMEQELVWRTAQQAMEFAADHNLAVRNTDIVERGTIGQLEIDQIKNASNIDIATRGQQLAEQLGIWQAGATRDDQERAWKQMQLEYGLNLNRFAFDTWMETGKFTQDVLNSERAYDLQVADQRDEWLKSDASLRLQEKLGISELALKNAISGKQIELERDKQLTLILLTEMGFEQDRAQAVLDRALEYYKTDKAAEAAADKGSMFGNLLGTVVGAGARIGAAFITSGGSEIPAAVD